MDKLTILKTYFKGRTDTFIKQNPKDSEKPYDRVFRELTDTDLLKHLEGEFTYGIYPIDLQDKVSLLLLDIDNLDTAFAIKVKNAILKTGIKETQFVTEFSGFKGYHIWLFFTQGIDASKAKRLGDIIAALSEVKVEVFPKQEEALNTGCGVKLPLGIHKESLKRSYFVDTEFKEIIDLSNFTADLISEEEVDDILNEFSYLVEETAKTRVKVKDITKILPCLQHIINNGVDEGCRDKALFWLAVDMFKKRIAKTYAVLSLQETNRKFRPPFKEKEFNRIVNGVFKEKIYKFNGCDDLKEFCRKEECPFKIDVIEVVAPVLKPITLSEVKKVFNKWLYLEDDSCVDVALATIIGNRFDIEPLWVIYIEPPSAGKTELLRAFLNARDMYTVSSLTPKSLISGKVNEKTYKTRDDPSLFAHINNKVLVVKDLTLILSLPFDQQNEIFGYLRDAYDGYSDRKTGETARIIGYKTKFGLLAGCTLALDSSHLIREYLGERFLKFRMHNNREKALQRAKENRIKIKLMRKELNDAVISFLAQDFNSSKKIEWDETADTQISILSDLITTLRTPVKRDRYKWSMIEVVPEAEYPMRLDACLRNLADSLALIRGKDKITEEEIKVIMKIGFDCLPRKILRVFQCLLANYGHWTETKEIGEEVNLNTDSVRYTCQDLVALGIAEINTEQSNKYFYRLKETIKEDKDKIIFLSIKDRVKSIKEQIFLAGKPKPEQEEIKEAMLQVDNYIEQAGYADTLPGSDI